MLKGKVVGNIVSTNKFDSLKGYKFLEIQLIENKTLTDEFIVAVDRSISAGIGEEVLVATGSAARVGLADVTAPVDALVVGIIDKIQK